MMRFLRAAVLAVAAIVLVAGVSRAQERGGGAARGSLTYYFLPG